MGIFDRFKSQRDIAKEEIKEVPWHMLTEVSQLDDIVALSKQKHVGIFKHSTRCGISKMVLRGFERDYDFTEDDAQIFMLDLLNHRDISNEIAARFQVFHESPQFIVLKDGNVLNFESHQGIKAGQLEN